MSLATRMKKPFFERGYWTVPAREHAIAWTVFYALYFAWIFARHPAMPLLVTANVFLHEAGHLFFSPFGRFMMFAGGTITQHAFCVIALATFAMRRDAHGAAFSLFWLGANLVHMGGYMADARAGELPLLGGGEHDWEYLFGVFGLLEWDVVIGAFWRGVGWLTMLAAPAWMLMFAIGAGGESTRGGAAGW